MEIEKSLKQQEAEVKKTENNNRYEGLSMMKNKMIKMKKTKTMKVMIRKQNIKIMLMITKNLIIMKQITWRLKNKLRQVVMKE